MPSSTTPVDAGGASTFQPLAAPARIADTRPSGETIDDRFEAIGPIDGGTVLELDVAGRAGVPSSAVAAILNVTTTNAVDRGFLTFFPCDQPQPNSANLNYDAGQIIANATVALLDGDGATCIFSRVDTNVVVDVTGAFLPGGLDALDAPQRIADTRPVGDTVDDVAEGIGPIAGGTELVLQVAGRAGVDGDAEAAILNVAVTNATGRGFITAHPCEDEPPLAANLNYEAGQIIANTVIATLDDAGRTCLFTNTTTNLVVDVTATTTGNYTPLTAPARIVDTRASGETVDGDVEKTGTRWARSTLEVPISGRAEVPTVDVPPFATAVVLNVTAAGAQGRGFVTVHPKGTDQPNAANLNFEANQVIANTVIAKIGVDGEICLHTSEVTELVVDVAGYFVGSAPPEVGDACPQRISNGTHPVGEYGVQPGRYISETGGGVCDFFRLSGPSQLDDFITVTSVFGGKIVADVLPSDEFVLFRFASCADLVPYEFPDPPPTNFPVDPGPGFHVVGDTVGPGTYTTTVPFGTTCTATRYRDFQGSPGGFRTNPSIIEQVSRLDPGPLVITVQPTDVGVAFGNTCTWIRS